MTHIIRFEKAQSEKGKLISHCAKVCAEHSGQSFEHWRQVLWARVRMLPLHEALTCKDENGTVLFALEYTR